MELKKILNGIEDLKAKGTIDVDVTEISCDSRSIKEGGMFVAIKGYETDGHKFIKNAIDSGAKVIVVEAGAKLSRADVKEDTTIVVAKDTRIALAKMACNFYGNPTSKFNLIGVTGTKGKTTTTFMIKAILEKMGQKVGLIGTVANYIGNRNLGESSRTTPDALELQKLFNEMVEEKVDTVVMEVSSQSLKLHRVDNCIFNIGVFTNFSEDHISPREHPDMEDYFNSKLKLLSMCKTSFINIDDLEVNKIKDLGINTDLKTYGIDNPADLLAKDITVTNVSADFKVKIGKRNERVKTMIPGRFSVYNSLAAIAVTTKLGADADNIKEAMLEVKIPGRCEMVENNKDISIMIDYAHSPESLQNVLKAIKQYTKGRVICVFGCGGDRDKSKRSKMGEISGQIATFTIITSDNPRTEKPEDIIEQIEEGMKRTKGQYKVIVNRQEAIKEAIGMAHKNDIIILAGKGHETYQEVKGVKNPFDEREIIRKIINS